MFDCERLHARLTAPSCAARWKKAAERLPDPASSLSHCRSCPIGAAHAGVTVSPVEAGADSWRNVCCRCLRHADRLIRDRHCVSCYNRDREARLGRNAKGGRPHLCDQLGTVTVAVRRAGAVELVTAQRVTGIAEVMVAIARATKVPISFGRPGRDWSALPHRAGDGSQDDPASGEVPSRSTSACTDREYRPVRAPTLRDRLLASSRLTWPELVAKHCELEKGSALRHVSGSPRASLVL